MHPVQVRRREHCGSQPLALNLALKSRMHASYRLPHVAVTQRSAAALQAL